MSLCDINSEIKEVLKNEDIIIPDNCYHLYIYENSILSEHTLPDKDSLYKIIKSKDSEYYVNFENWNDECCYKNLFPELINTILSKYNIDDAEKKIMMQKYIIGGLYTNIKIRKLVLHMYTNKEFEDEMYNTGIDKFIIRRGLETMNLIIPLNENYMKLIKYTFDDKSISDFMIVDLNKSQNLFGYNNNEEELFFRFNNDELRKILPEFKFDYNYLAKRFLEICNDDYILVRKLKAILDSIEEFYLEGRLISYYILSLEIELYEDDELNEEYRQLLLRHLELGEFILPKHDIQKLEKMEKKWRLFTGEN